MIRQIQIALISFLMLLFMAGCGERGSSAEPTASLNMDTSMDTAVDFVETGVSAEMEIDRSGFDWRQSEWKKEAPKGEGKALYVQEYIDNMLYNADFSYKKRKSIDTLCYQSLICTLERFTMEDGSFRYYMNRYDGDTGVTTHMELDSAGMLGEESGAVIGSFDIRNEEEYVFFRITYGEGHDYDTWVEDDDLIHGITAIHTDIEGNIVKSVDLFPGVSGSDFAMDQGWGRMWPIKVDAQGNYYIYSAIYDMPRRLLVLDTEGQEACIINPFPKEAQIENQWEYETICFLMKTPDGDPVFALQHPGRSETILFTCDQQEKKMKQLMLLPQYDLFNIQACMTEEGICYYLSDDGFMYKWDLYTGICVKVMNYAAEDITSNVGWLRLTMNSQGKLVIYEREDEFSSTYVLGTEVPAVKEDLRIVSLVSNITELKAAANDYSRKSRGSNIVVESSPKDLEAYRDRLMADLVAGKGPDAMYVSREDLEILYEKGLLEDMTGLLSPETAEQIFPGVLGCGKIEGKQVGFPMDARLMTMFVNRNVWDQDSWSLEDVIALVEQEENFSELKAVVATSTFPYGNRGIFQHLVLQDLRHSPFLDMEQGTCSFDCDEFVKILELCKRYGAMTTSSSDAIPMMHEGKALAYVADLRDLNAFCHNMGDLGEDFQCVGYPAEGGSGSYWDSSSFLVVRKDAECIDTIKEFVEYLYSLRRQRKQSTPLHREVYDRYIVSMDDESELGYVYLSSGQGIYIALRAKPDGSSWTDVFLELAEKSEPCLHSDEAIVNIVLEEVDRFFSGEGDAARVAEIIQSRVSMYLAEQI